MNTIKQEHSRAKEDEIYLSRGSSFQYKVYFFGPFRILRGKHVLEEPAWRRNKAKTLLKWFVLNPGVMFSADQLVKLFWPHITRTAGLRNLHVTINYLRHILEPDLPARQESSFIRRSKNNFYCFEMDETWWSDLFDIHYHVSAAKEAEQRRDTMALFYHYHTITSYCYLEFLPEDTYDDTFCAYRRKYDIINAQVLEKLIHLCTHLEKFDEAFVYSQRVLSSDPYCESAVKAIIQIFLQQGNIPGAIRKIDDFQKLLQQDLGINPSDDLLSLRKNILIAAPKSRSLLKKTS
ncbi:AfsR/SARP family transcriptional regulator [Tengunoibacter tsumagoiensis]|uniref:OmpR/PhoB-type domain-containing protein n=1 Tax=Tengunoibacter tsumagoiensis TaxID=2014871 RepID=A0A402A730_9CHLR|nr:BTAD domain-containing putative transcriptional regulator [Tengunoibacter tsumagoiensis]GCE14908.1 hypothetical protein KTT_47670 [Tengunoibacter tsumagoiensis]